MKFAPAVTLLWSSAAASVVLLSSAVVVVDAEKKCETNVDKYFPSTGGYYIQGAHSLYGQVDEESPYRSRMVDARWDSSLKYRTGETVVCRGRYCDPACKKLPGCPTYLNVKSCARLRFCYADDSGDDVWRMPDLNSLNDCDFSGATKICNKKGGQGDACCEYRVEHEGLLDHYYFASKQGCFSGLVLAVKTTDFYDIADWCYDDGLITKRIRDCNCLFDATISGKPSTLSEPCHSTFAAGCIEGGPGLDAACCDDQTCVNKLFDIETKTGKKYEKKRQRQCTDWIPGKCDVKGNEDPKTFDCCDNMCSSCGIKQNPFAAWEYCEYDKNTSLLQCGNVKKRGEPYYCDFDACPTTSKWHPKGKKYKKWQQWIGLCDECTQDIMPTIFDTYNDYNECLQNAESEPRLTKKQWKKACQALKKGCEASPGNEKCERKYMKKCAKAGQCPLK